MTNTIEIFCSCAPEDQKYLDELKLHLNLLKERSSVKLWSHSAIDVGTEWETECARHLNSAPIALFLVSAPLLASPHGEQEVRQAIDLYHQHKIKIVPVLLRPVDLQGTPLEGLQCLPQNGKPVVKWQSRDEAFLEIAAQIKKMIWEYLVPPTQNFTSSISGQSGSEGGQTISEFMNMIVNPHLALFRAREKRHRTTWIWQQMLAIGTASITLLFTLLDVLIRAFGATSLAQIILQMLLIFSATATLIYVLLLSQSYSARRWQYYQQHSANLSQEARAYQNKQGIYALSPDPQRFFKERVFQIIQNVGDGTKSTDETQDYIFPEAHTLRKLP